MVDISRPRKAGEISQVVYFDNFKSAYEDALSECMSLNPIFERRKLGIEVPSGVLSIADEVIQ